MSVNDEHGLALTGASRTAADAYQAALRAFHCLAGDPLTLLAQALTDSPRFVMAHVLTAHLTLAGANAEAAAMGQAAVKTIYSYLGYYNVCHLGAEIKGPEKVIPRSIFLSILGIAALYLLLNWSVGTVIPWQEVQSWQAGAGDKSQFIISVFMERLYGPGAAQLATALVLLVAFASLFAVLLGYSRIPYAAAADGEFLPIFGKLHPTKQFPYVSLLLLGGTGFVFSLLFRLGEVISAILAMRILVQFVGQAVGLMLLRRRRGTAALPFKMPLYPLPVIVAIIVWLFVFVGIAPAEVTWAGLHFKLYFQFAALGMMALGTVAFLLWSRRLGRWPFAQ